MIAQRRFLVCHPTGNTFVRALLQELESQELLQKYYTTLGIGEEANPLMKRLFGLRAYSIRSERLSCQWFPETFRLLPWRNKSQEERRRQVDRSYHALDQKVSRILGSAQGGILHAYEDGAAKSFRRAKDNGILCSYELPIAHWTTVRKLLAEEAERLPEWEPTLESTREPEEKLARKQEELLLADRITCPNEFVLRSLPLEIRKKKPCLVAPFGSPDFSPPPKKRADGKILKLLFVGSMSQRKGLADLMKAMELIDSPSISLSILGQPSMPMSFYRSNLSSFRYLSPRSNKEVRKVMQEHDVLILPSIVEGRALVQQEALACGLPLVVTENAGGEDLIDEAETGFLVPIRQPQAIAEKIEWFAANKKLLPEMSDFAQQKASLYRWKDYAMAIIGFCLRNKLPNTDN